MRYGYGLYKWVKTYHAIFLGDGHPELQLFCGNTMLHHVETLNHVNPSYTILYPKFYPLNPCLCGSVGLHSVAQEIDPGLALQVARARGVVAPWKAMQRKARGEVR